MTSEVSSRRTLRPALHWKARSVAFAAYLAFAPRFGLAEPVSNDRDHAHGPGHRDGLAERVLDAQGMSELSLENLLDLPVTTASGKAEERSLAAANVTIISRETIERRGYRSLAEILRDVPGMYTTYDYVDYSVGVREVTGGYGGGTRIVKIMVDGFPVSFRPALQAFIGPEFIPVEAIARVEVAKGPLSALYGANAFLATVNVITREPDDDGTEVTQRYHVTNGNPGWGSSAIATLAGIDTSLLLSASIDRIDRSGAQAYQTYPNQNLNQSYTLVNSALLEPSADDTARPVSLFGRFDYHHDKAGDFRLEGGYQELDSKAEFLLNSQVTHRSRVNIANQWGALHWSKRSRNLTMRGYLGLSNGAPTSNYQMYLSRNYTSSYHPNFDYTAINGLGEISYDFGHWLQADLGADTERSREGVLYYTETIYSKSGYNPYDQIEAITGERSKDYSQFGTYLQLRSAPLRDLPDLRLTTAGRLDWIQFGEIDYPTQTSFRAAIAYRFSPRATLRVIGGRAFQTPSGTLLFTNGGFGTNVGVIGTQTGNYPYSIRPQVVSSAELVLSTQIGKALTLEASAYYQALTDAIRFNQAASQIRALNGGEVHTAGAELAARLMLGPLRPYATVSASRQLSAALPPELGAITSFSGSPSLYPRLFGYAGFDIDILQERLFGNLELRWAGERGTSQYNFYNNDSALYSLPAYCTVDLRISTGGLRLIDGRHLTRFLLSAHNVLGTKYSEPGFSGVDIPQMRRSMMFQMRQEL